MLMINSISVGYWENFLMFIIININLSVGYWENFLIFIIIHINLSVGYWDYIMVAEYVSQESFCRMAVSKEYTDIVPHKV